MESLEIAPLGKAPDAVVELPGSKSITNRALLLAGLANGTSRLSRVLIADDTEAMLDCIRAIGASVDVGLSRESAVVLGTSGVVPDVGEAHAWMSGTTARFVAPVLALASGEWRLSGDDQLARRPMEDLFAALRSLGVEAASIEVGRSLPARIKGPLRSGTTTVSGSTSSQFLSGLLMAAPLVLGGLNIEVSGSLVSRPYVEMSIAVMQRFGARVKTVASQYLVESTGYQANDLQVEPDASGASYFFAAAAATGGRVRVPGLSASSLQGDLRFVDVLAQMGATVVYGDDYVEVTGGELRGVDVDLSDFSDMVPTLAVLASLASGPTHIHGVGFIRNKESDRIGAVVTELRGCGIDAEEEPDGLVVRPGGGHGASVATYGDHRIAMAFSVLGLVVSGIVIEEPSCVAKTFPDFFERLEQLRA